MRGGPGNDNLSDGDTDVDRIEGGAGDDDFYGGAGPVNFEGGPGDDNLTGGDGDDELNGGTGDDNLVGGRGDDRLNAGPGDDDVDGGRGADRIDTADAQAEHSLTCGQGGDQLIADGRDPVNLDCETSTADGSRRARRASRWRSRAPGGCTSGRIVLTAGGKRRRLGQDQPERARVRVQPPASRRKLTRARHDRRARQCGPLLPQRGRYELR